MMDDELSVILDDFLSDKSMIKMINFKIKKIIGCIRSDLVFRLKDAEKYRIATRVDKYLSNLITIKGSNSNDTLLHVVANYGTVEIASRLLQHGADVHAENRKGRTPIFYAIGNSAEMVKVLLNDSKVNDWGLFCQVLLYGTEEIFRLLLNKSLLEIRNNLSPDAISTGNSKFDEFQNTEMLINIFLQHELHLSNMEASYPLLIFFAARMFRIDILHLILDDCGKNLVNIQRKNLISFKEKRNIRNRSKIKWYELRAPEELNVQGSDGETGLHLAVQHQLLEVARFLLQEGADPNCQDYNNLTPLHVASALGNEEMCRLLLSFNANVNPNLCHQLSPLNIVCCNYPVNVKIIKLLLENGADPKSRNGRGIPVLLQACEYGLLEVVKILVEYGACVGILDRNGNSALHHAVFSDSLELIDFLVEKGLDINIQNYGNGNFTPLMCALKFTQEIGSGMIEKLVSCGANINAINSNGEAALHIAVDRCSVVEVECLLRLGADWMVLHINKHLFAKLYDLSMGKTQEVLLSFMALRGNEWRSHVIMFYIGYNLIENLRGYQYFKKSELEVTKLRTTTISKNCKITYYDFLTEDFYSAVKIAKNSNFKKFLNSKIYVNEFPCYATLLKIHFRRTQELENFVDKTVDFILNYTKLPIEIVETIMSNLRFIDFRVFGSVLSSR